MELDILAKHGANIRELAKATGRSRNTVRRYLREGEAAATRKAAPKRADVSIFGQAAEVRHRDHAR